jgi:uncharacterized membrane protein YfcA
MEYFIICPLCFLAGFVDSIAGGGGLISLPAFLFAGLPVHAAIATNKLQATMGTAVATLRYALAGYLALGSAAIGIFCGLLGSSIGARIALATNDFAFRIIMLAILPLVAFYVLRAKDLSKNAEKPLPPSQALPLIATIALVIGIYDGFYGPGTGTFLMLLLTVWARQSLQQATGTTKAINLATNVAALAVFLWKGAALIPLGLTAGLFSICGNWLGAHCFTQKGSRIVRPIVLTVLTLFAVKLVTDIIRSLSG